MRQTILYIYLLLQGETETPVPASSPEPDEREGETQWEKILTSTTRPLVICDIDFTDLQEEDIQEHVVTGYSSPSSTIETG